jgi:uncharacterized protein (TIGR02231 family)
MHPLTPLCAAAALLLTPTLPAQAAARISQVLVFPGGAEVQRVQPVAAGTREAVFSCIPARIQLDSLQARGGSGLQVGELRVHTQSSEAVPECSGNPQLDTQIKQLEDQKAGLAAERDALELVLGYLKASGDPKTPASSANAENLRRQAVEALKGRHQLQRRMEGVDEQLKPLLAQREEARGGVEQWHRVSVQVVGSGELTLSSRTPHAGWQPLYRADLASSESRVAFERRAELQQASGESWRDVKLLLSTREPRRGVAPPEPQAWWLRPYQPRPRALPAAPAAPAAMMKAAPAPFAEAVEVSGSRIDADLPRFETDFDLQFAVPGTVTLPSGSERRSFTLERLSWPAELVTQVQPRVQAQAYLMATVKRPEGFFPAGRLLLARDGEFIGEGRFAVGNETEQRLAFGPDDRLRVRVDPEAREGANGGFIGNRQVLTLQRRYVLENVGSKALAVQVVEAAPVPQHEDIKVESRFEPQPAVSRWRELDGVMLWRFSLGPKAVQRLGARYELSAPREMNVAGWP